MGADGYGFGFCGVLSKRVWFALTFLLLYSDGIFVPATAETNDFQGALRTQLSYGVSKVELKRTEIRPSIPCRAMVGDYLCLQVINLDQWMANQSRDSRIEDLILYLDGEALPGLHPTFFDHEWYDEKNNRVASLGIWLDVNNANLSAWKRLLRSPTFRFERPMRVSLGYPGGAPMNSWIYPDPEIEKSPFFLVILSTGKLWVGTIVLVGALLIFMVLACRTDILRDPNLPLRPDGSKPFSLARSQMAFWFFLVIAAYFFLWLIIHDTDTLNSSTVALIGISAGTAVGSALIDTGKRDTRDLRSRVIPTADLNRSNSDILAELRSRQHRIEAQIAELQARNWKEFEKHGHCVAAENRKRECDLEECRKLFQEQIVFFESPPWRRAILDVLSENGVITFHRFQMCVWTVVLGIIFLWDVCSEMTMPRFSAPLLGLMGISSGTFIGFKIPNQKAS